MRRDGNDKFGAMKNSTVYNKAGESLLMALNYQVMWKAYLEYRST